MKMIPGFSFVRIWRHEESLRFGDVPALLNKIVIQQIILLARLCEGRSMTR